jgi:hypothetical protein
MHDQIHILRVTNFLKFSRYIINRTHNSFNIHAFIASDEGKDGHSFFCVPVQGQRYHDSVRAGMRNVCGDTDTHRPYDDHTNHVKDVTVVLKISMPLLLSARMPGYHLKSVKKRSNT